MIDLNKCEHNKDYLVWFRTPIFGNICQVVRWFDISEIYPAGFYIFDGIGYDPIGYKAYCGWEILKIIEIEPLEGE